MPFTLHKQYSLSATSKKRDPQKYKWYTLAKGKAKFDSAHKTFELELNKGEKFGLKFYRGSYFLLDASDLYVQFKLSVEEGKKLIAASKPFSGKVGGKKVEGGEIEEKPKPSRRPRAKKETFDTKKTTQDLKKALVSAVPDQKVKVSGDTIVLTNEVGNETHISIVSPADKDSTWFKLKVDRYMGKNSGSMGTNILPSHGSVKGAIESLNRSRMLD